MLVIVKKLEELQSRIGGTYLAAGEEDVRLLADVQKRLEAIEGMADREHPAPVVRGIRDALGPSEPLTPEEKVRAIDRLIDEAEQEGFGGPAESTLLADIRAIVEQ